MGTPQGMARSQGVPCQHTTPSGESGRLRRFPAYPACHFPRDLTAARAYDLALWQRHQDARQQGATRSNAGAHAAYRTIDARHDVTNCATCLTLEERRLLTIARPFEHASQAFADAIGSSPSQARRTVGAMIKKMDTHRRTIEGLSTQALVR